jgi:beta-lactamase regulating signal transducer with metallopeptidase domain
MGIGVSLILIAVGAILAWAVNATVSGIDINTVGDILMIVGIAGLLISLLFLDSFLGRGRRRRVVREDEDGY